MSQPQQHEEKIGAYRKMAQLFFSVLDYGDQEFTVRAVANKTGFLTEVVGTCFNVLAELHLLELAERRGYYRLTETISKTQIIAGLKTIYRPIEEQKEGKVS